MVKDAISGGVERLFNKLGDLKDSFVAKLHEVKEGIVAGLATLKNGIIDTLNTVKNWIGDKVQAVKDTVLGLVERFKEMMSNLFHRLFVPDGNVWQTKASELKASFDDKLPIVGQLSDAYQRVTGIISGSGVKTRAARAHEFTPPTFTIHAFGNDYNLIDLSLFEPYMPFVRGLIAGFSWFFFITRYYKKISELIMANGDSGGGTSR